VESGVVYSSGLIIYLVNEGLEARPQHRTLIARDPDVVRSFIATHVPAVSDA